MGKEPLNEAEKSLLEKLGPDKFIDAMQARSDAGTVAQMSFVITAGHEVSHYLHERFGCACNDDGVVSHLLDFAVSIAFLALCYERGVDLGEPMQPPDKVMMHRFRDRLEDISEKLRDLGVPIETLVVPVEGLPPELIERLPDEIKRALMLDEEGDDNADA